MLLAVALVAALAVARTLHLSGAPGLPALGATLPPLPSLSEEERAATQGQQQLKVYVHPLKVRPTACARCAWLGSPSLCKRSEPNRPGSIYSIWQGQVADKLGRR